MGNETKTIIKDAHHDAKEGIVSPVMAKAAENAIGALTDVLGDGALGKMSRTVGDLQRRIVLTEDKETGKKITLDEAAAYFTQWCEARQKMENDDG